MATIYVFMGIICLGVFGSDMELKRSFLAEYSGLTSTSNLIKDGKNTSLVYKSLVLKNNNQTSNPKHTWGTREMIISIAQSQLSIREATGKNDGKVVESYLAYTGNKKGAPWCASFVSWVFGKAGISQPCTAWSPALFPKDRRIKKPLIASVFGIYMPQFKRIAHCGIVVKIRGKWLTTIEGNTNTYGSREGDGVYQKLRHQRNIMYYADWINKPRKEAGYEK